MVLGMHDNDLAGNIRGIDATRRGAGHQDVDVCDPGLICDEVAKIARMAFQPLPAVMFDPRIEVIGCVTRIGCAAVTVFLHLNAVLAVRRKSSHRAHHSHVMIIRGEPQPPGDGTAMGWRELRKGIRAIDGR